MKRHGCLSGGQDAHYRSGKLFRALSSGAKDYLVGQAFVFNVGLGGFRLALLNPQYASISNTLFWNRGWEKFWWRFYLLNVKKSK